MIQVIPAIITKDFNELDEKIKIVEPYFKWAQLDIMDGKFVNNFTWPYAEQGKNNPSDLKKIKTNLKLEAHLMIENLEDNIDNWINSGVKRIIFHYEAVDNCREIIERIKEAELEVGLAINPNTDISAIDNFIKEIDLVLIMTVDPGFGGQDFLISSFDKIRQLREKYENVNIGVDGGINLENAPKVIIAGANILYTGTTIFKSGDIKKTIKKLKNI